MIACDVKGHDDFTVATKEKLLSFMTDNVCSWKHWEEEEINFKQILLEINKLIEQNDTTAKRRRMT